MTDYDRFLVEAVTKHGAQIFTLDQIADIWRGEKYKPGQILAGEAFEQGRTDGGVLVLSASNHRSSKKDKIDVFDLKAILTANVAATVKQDQLLQPDDILVMVSGKSGKVARFEDFLAELLGPESRTRVVATDKHAVIRLQNEFKESFGKHGLSRILSSALYQLHIQGLADGAKVRKIDPRLLAGIKIPIFPRNKAILLNILFHALPQSPLEKILSRGHINRFADLLVIQGR
ncbi:MAG: hypothetical protein J0M04_24975 [Verrucomicrobia bacterium]|nr:hypothetical protein [Verrucomicrobiota bacterium]